MGAILTRQELDLAHCWEATDEVPRRPAMTEFRQRLRYHHHQRLWADLLSSAAMSFNLFGDLAGDLELADRTVHAWMPDAPGDRSGAFKPGAIEAVNGTELLEMWLEHLLLLSMLQHVSGSWSWGRYVVVHPAGNSDFADGCDRYRDLLVDQSTFLSVTVEALLDSDVMPAPMTEALRQRYLPS